MPWFWSRLPFSLSPLLPFSSGTATPGTHMRFLASTAIILGALVALPAADPPARPLAPTAVTWDKPGGVLGEAADTFTKQSGVPIAVAPGLLKAKCDARFKGTPFWEALQSSADAAKARIALTDGGRKVELHPRGASQEVAATSGAFRVVAQQVVGRTLLDQGVTYHEVQLLVHWEPRLRVYRIDTAPHVSAASDVLGSKITADSGSGQILPANATSEMRVRLNGLTRKSEQITALAGVFTVTAADKLLAFAFEAPGGKLPDAQTQAEVSASLKRLEQKDGLWEVVIEANYPKGQPVFESFQGEWWLRDNRLLLVSPAGKAVAIDDYEVAASEGGAPLVVIHRFKENAMAGFGNPTAKGWKLVYETPSPLAVVKVPFELKGIPLP